MRLSFLGAAGTVTGSKFLLETADNRLLVDCGLFQGQPELRERNWQGLPLGPDKLDAVLLTHAHIDHSGYIPRLVAEGFSGPVICSQATADLAAILLPDSGRIQEDDAEAANRYGYSRHKPALPLYTEAQARASLPQFKPVAFGVPHRLGDEVSLTLSRAGHILGASFISLTFGDGTSILFSGDIGRPDSPLMKPPAQMQGADYIVLESTYGDRRHSGENPADQIAEVIRRTAARGGSVVVPAFAVGRTQDLLYHLHALKRAGRIPDLPVFLDSPMAIDVTELLLKHKNEHRLSPQFCADICGIARYTRTVEQSKAINANTMPKVIISASGMATGGRVLHHLKQLVGDVRNTVLLAGYQAAGTRGDRLARGEKSLRIHGQEYPVRAEIVQIDIMSAHADYEEILDWLRDFRTAPRKVFITHGEPQAAAAMREHIIDSLGWQNVIVPAHGHVAEL
jgi:metallo-beta-lactamase family protein